MLALNSTPSPQLSQIVNRFIKAKIAIPILVFLFITPFLFYFYSEHQFQKNIQRTIDSIMPDLYQSISVRDSYLAKKQLAILLNSIPISKAQILIDQKIFLDSEENSFFKNSFSTSKEYAIVSPWNQKLGLLRLYFAVFPYHRVIGLSFILIAILMSALIIYLLKSSATQIEHVLRQITHLTNCFNNLQTQQITDSLSSENEIQSQEGKDLLSALNKHIKTIKFLTQAEEKIKAEAKIVNLSREISHDLRSPLMALNTLLRTTHGLTPGQMDLFQNAINRINQISNNLLNESKILKLSSANDYINSDINLEKYIHDLCKEKDLTYPDKNFIINTQIKKNLVLFNFIDLSKFGRVLSNLLNNSIEANSTQIYVTMDLRQDQLIVSIQDNGCGISQEKISRFLTPGNTSKINGNGLGLSSAKVWSEEIGGKFSINSQINVGTLIQISITDRSEEKHQFSHSLIDF